MPAKSAQPKLKILIVEPNKNLIVPYSYLPGSFKFVRVYSTQLGLRELTKITPDMVFLSGSFSASKTVRFLEALKNSSRSDLIPLIIVVDLSHRLNFVPGTSWGGKIAIIDSFISKKEFRSTISRVLRT